MAKVVVPNIPDSRLIEAALDEIFKDHPTAHQVLDSLYQGVVNKQHKEESSNLTLAPH